MSAAKRAAEFERANVIAARVILENPERFGGESAGVVRWARLFQSRMETPAEGAAASQRGTGAPGEATQRALPFMEESRS